MLEVFFCFIVGISSGNTVVVDCEKDGVYAQHSVRLMAVGTRTGVGESSDMAYDVLSDLALGKQARLECTPIKQSSAKEPWVCTAWVSPQSALDGPLTLDVGLAMISVGAAWWNQGDLAYQTLQQRGQYEFAQIEAKAKGVGGWQGSLGGFVLGKYN